MSSELGSIYRMIHSETLLFLWRVGGYPPGNHDFAYSTIPFEITSLIISLRVMDNLTEISKIKRPLARTLYFGIRCS